MPLEVPLHYEYGRQLLGDSAAPEAQFRNEDDKEIMRKIGDFYHLSENVE